MSFRARLLLLVGSASLVGCDAILGLGDYKEGPPTSTGGSGGATSTSGATMTTSSSGDTTTTTTTTGTMSSSASGMGGSGGAMACTPNEVVPCPYLGTPGTEGHGHCAAGTMTCKTDGSGFEACIGQIVDMPENCTTGDDEDCDDVINNGCTCMPNQSVSCYSGPGGTDMTGICHRGNAICNAQGTALGPCMGEQTPLAEDCGTTADENCNGAEMVAPGIDTLAGCECLGTSTQTCYSGPAATQNVGKCKSGTKICNAGHYPTNCPGEVLPATEVCQAASGDENCDGLSCSEPAWGVFAGDSNHQYGGETAVDPAGNVYWIGQFTGSISLPGTPPTNLVSAGGDDVLVAKFSATGALLWAKRFGGSGDQEGAGIVADANNVWVLSSSGTDFGGGLKTGMTLAKLSGATGNHVWSRACNQNMSGPLSILPTRAGGLGLDPSGNVYLGAHFRSSGITCEGGANLTGGTNANLAAVVAKYNTSGTHQWSKSFADANDTTINGVAVDGSGSVWFTGYHYSLLTFGCAGNITTGAYITKLDTNGTCSYQRGFTGGEGLGITVDATGSPTVVGKFSGNIITGANITSQGNDDMFVAHYDSVGTHLWTKAFGGASYDGATDVAVDANGDAIVTGFFQSSAITFGGPAYTLAGFANAFLLKLSKTNGSHIWSTSFTSSGSSGRVNGESVAVGGPLGLIFVSGSNDGTAQFGMLNTNGFGSPDMFLVRVDP